MSKVIVNSKDNKTPVGKLGRESKLKMIKKDFWLYILLIPGVIHFIVFKYLPMWGILIAFQDFNAYLGFFNSPWVGFKNFIDFFTNPDLYNI